MLFEWDENKEKINITKHGIDFRAAATVFLDERKIDDIYDHLHSQDEDRYIVLGMMAGTTTVLFVSYTERGDIIRIISAREATKEEREGYYHGYYSL